MLYKQPGLLCVLLVTIGFTAVKAALPHISDCVHLNDHPLDTTNPESLFGANNELSQHGAPRRVGSLRQSRALPTGHFATNQIKGQPVPMRLFPYEANMDSHGITYDAYTMDRWTAPSRTDYMEQQSAWKSGEPWNRLETLGTNMKQMVSGPDGNPLGVFTGKSGIRIGIRGSGEPTLTDIADLYANFMFHGANGGKMEVPVVRGATLVNHIITKSNPVVKPYCLSSVNGVNVQFDCPVEASAGDGGSGYLSGRCHGGQLSITLHNTRPIPDVTLLQWSARSLQTWAQRGMVTCDTKHCQLSRDGKTVTVTVPNVSGTMAFALNYIGHYVVPPNWGDHPQTAVCGNRKRSETNSTMDSWSSFGNTTEELFQETKNLPLNLNQENEIHKFYKTGMKSKRSPGDINMNAQCDHQRNLEIKVDVSGNNIPGINKIQYAVESVSKWRKTPSMHTCVPGVCTRRGSEVIIKVKSPGDTIRISNSGKKLYYVRETDRAAKTVEDKKKIKKAIEYYGCICISQLLALNIIGFTTLPRGAWFDNAYTVHCGGSSVHSGKTGSNTGHHTTSPNSHTTKTPNIAHKLSSSKKFILELNEPGTHLSHQTRKFVLYFSQSVKGEVDTGNGQITFTLDHSSQPYSGLVQLGYLGAGPRGDKTHDGFLDSQAGIYSYKPHVSYCVSESRKRGYMSFDWNPTDVSGREARSGKLLMVAMPHHALLLQKYFAGSLMDTVYGFKGFQGNDWLMELDLQPASMAPDSVAVNKIKHNHHELKMITDAISRDAANINLKPTCDHSDSYNVGKALGMVSRLASISRAFGTNHYQQLDASLKTCLEKWLRIDDTLDDKWKFHYDNVWGGMFLRATSGQLSFGTDYGFPFYNDHHFHLGYFLYALSYYVKHHQAWGKAHKSRIYALARDVGNPSAKDVRFPVARHKDTYTGFSWATGIVPGERQEESASESINCYHGLAALGEAFGDDNLKHVGQVLLSTEILSVREYWQVRHHNRHQFPSILQQFGVVGQIAENAYYVYTLDWPCDPNKFPMRHGCLVGIQVIPLTAVSKYWVDKEWSGSIKQTCEWAINPSLAPGYKLADPTNMRPLAVGWQAFCYAALSPLDATHRSQAAEYVKNRKPQELVGGTGAASMLLFILGAT